MSSEATAVQDAAAGRLRPDLCEPPAAECSPSRRIASVLVALFVPLASGEILSLVLGAIPRAAIAQNVGFYVGATTAVVVLAGRQSRRDVLGLEIPSFTFVICGAAFGLIRATVWLTTLTTHAAHSPTWNVIAAVIGQVVMVAMVEELQYRGLLLSRLLEACRGRTGAGVLLAALIFALLHLRDAAFVLLPTYFCDGVLFAVLRLESRSIFTGAISHAVFNASTVVWPVATTLPSGMVYRYELVVVLADLAMVIALLVTLRRRS